MSAGQNRKWPARTAINLTRIGANGAETLYLKAEQFYRLGQINMGVQVQAIGCSVTPAFTSYPEEDVTRAIESGDVDLLAAIFDERPPVAPSKMALFPVAATYIRVALSGPGEAILSSF